MRANWFDGAREDHVECFLSAKNVSTCDRSMRATCIEFMRIHLHLLTKKRRKMQRQPNRNKMSPTAHDKQLQPNIIIVAGISISIFTNI